MPLGPISEETASVLQSLRGGIPMHDADYRAFDAKHGTEPSDTKGLRL